MKHIRLFKSETEFEEVKSELETPWLVLNDDIDEVLYSNLIINEKDITDNEYVDLNLPSGLKWASCNLGAKKPCEYGDYYMWGSLTPNTNDICDWEHAPFNNGACSYDNEYFNSIKETICPNGILSYEYDAIYQSTGGKSHMPTLSDFKELYANTESVWYNCTYIGEDHEEHTVMGRKFTGTNGNSIFIPALGNRRDSSFANVGSYVYVWSSSLYPGMIDSASSLFSNSGVIYTNYDIYRYYGLAMRGVL